MFTSSFLGVEDHNDKSVLTFLFPFPPFASCRHFFLFRYSYMILIVSLGCVRLSWHRNHNYLEQSKNKKGTSEKCGCITNSVWNHHNRIPDRNMFRSSYYSLTFRDLKHIPSKARRSRIQAVNLGNVPLVFPHNSPKRRDAGERIFEDKAVVINCCQNAIIIKNMLSNKHKLSGIAKSKSYSCLHCGGWKRFDTCF